VTSLALAPARLLRRPQFRSAAPSLQLTTTSEGNSATSVGVCCRVTTAPHRTPAFWPRLAVTLLTGTPGHVSVEASAPFLIHPTQHFFFGFGPAIASDLTGPDHFSAILGEFMIGGYFNS
jgi:hypothetical protein